MNVLIACEESQRVCSAFRLQGITAYSCDILKPSGGHPEWHICADVIGILGGGQLMTMNGQLHYVDHWDMIIAHPPCTYLTTTGNRWFNVDKYGRNALDRWTKRYEAADFFMAIANAPCKRIAIENPVGYMSTYYRKPDQIIQPYMFGDPYEKRTCLWLKNLPCLVPTNIVKPYLRKKFDSGKSMSSWYADSWKLPKNERSKIRSKTFWGIAQAMSYQWGHFYCNDNYYILNDLDGYGNNYPICVTFHRALELTAEWFGSDAPEFHQIWHVASDDEIRKYGFMED